MKELSTEEKAKAYDKAIERARKLYERGTITESLGHVFPELKESEDERIRKALIRYFTLSDEHTYYEVCGVSYRDIVVWLEKQGEQKPVNNVEPKFKVGDWITDGEKVWKIGYIEDDMYIEHRGTISGGGAIESIDKHYHLWTIQDAKDGDVLYMDNGLSTCTFIYKSINNTIIQKYASYNKFGFEDRHYLVLNDGYVCPATKEQRNLLFQKMKEAGYEWDTDKKELRKIEHNPAWSEEDEVKDNWELIHEFVNKFGRIPKDEDELNVLVEYVLKRQKPTEWGEEDEKMLNLIIAVFEVNHPNEYFKANELNDPNMRAVYTEEIVTWLKSIEDRVLSQPKREWSEEDEEMIQALNACINVAIKGGMNYISFGSKSILIGKVKNWLKSLKNKYTWKPSDEQMDALRYVTNFDYGGHKATLVSLYEQLKKLKEY